MSTPPTKPHPTAVPKAKAKQDEAIIGTNDYSIVSKRSVEKLYLKDEPEFLRTFVPKFKRRAPLINRGYWLRMKAIEAVVERFLRVDSVKRKVVVNLGCGYEPLPFRMLWKHPSLCQDVQFVDVDFPQLIKKKVEMILNDSTYDEQLGPGVNSKTRHAALALESPRYCAVACDLGVHPELDQVFRQILRLDEASILFIGEVSVVYMPAHEATNLISFCSTFPDATMCLLEQHLPVGKNHPFARTMLAHFDKQTPLRGLSTFDSISAQRKRFRDAGWPSTDVINLWSLWQDPAFLKDEERRSLDLIEPFDEWEALAMFAGHYFLLVAKTADASGAIVFWTCDPPPAAEHAQTADPAPAVHLRSTDLGITYGRHSGALMHVDENQLALVGGTTSDPSQGAYDMFSCSDSDHIQFTPPPVVMNGFTITRLLDKENILLGGRASPGNVNKECYVHRDGQWMQGASPAVERFRHAAVSVLESRCMLVYGGKTADGCVLDSWALYTVDEWLPMRAFGDSVPPLFGCSLVAISHHTSAFSSGMLIGGMDGSGCLQPSIDGVWNWSLMRWATHAELYVRLEPVTSIYPGLSSSLRRFGAKVVSTTEGALLIGGIGAKGPLQRSAEIVLITDQGEVKPCLISGVEPEDFPMLIGHAVHNIDDQTVFMAGGGTVCFSFGSHWNISSYTLHLGDNKPPGSSGWHLVKEDSQTRWPVEPTCTKGSCIMKSKPAKVLVGTPIPRLCMQPDDPTEVDHRFSRPLVLTELHLGQCVSLWSPSYLIERVGSDKPTVIHAATSSHLDFLAKNFAYETRPFGSFVQSASIGEHVYMRALSSSSPSRQPANLETDYPGIASDFKIPQELSFAAERQHSSVLRVSGNINMWLHYDVMSNILCQITGSKRVMLFPPQHVSALDFAPGSTTSSLNVFSTDAKVIARLQRCQPCEVVLQPGEVLLIPACWPHATASAPVDKGEAVASTLSVAVNVFFRSLDDRFYAAGRDVYGNRDIEMYQNGRRALERIAKALDGIDDREEVKKLAREYVKRLREKKRSHDQRPGARDVERILDSGKGLPEDIAHFYLDRMADELQRYGKPARA